jgi:Sulfatase
MRTKRVTRRYLALSAPLIVVCLLAAGTGRAQQINGVPGSPDATVTIDGKQIPPPPMPFGGAIKESYLDSTPYWPPRVVPPKGAPNILLIMTDDQGYGVSSTFGGAIPTRALDRIASAGLRYPQFHSTGLVSERGGKIQRLPSG